MRLSRAQLRSILRERVKDKNSDQWTDAELDLELNLAAQDVLLSLANSRSQINYGRKTLTITTNGGSSYPLYSVDDFFYAIHLYGGTCNRDGRLFNEKEKAHLLDQYSEVIDDKGRILYYIEYDATERVHITITGSPTGGTFTLAFNGQTTVGIAFNAAASAVQTALAGLSTIGTGNVSVSGEVGGPYTVTFAGTLANLDTPAITANGASLTGGSSPGVTVQHYHYTLNFLRAVLDGDYTFAYSIEVPEIPTGAASDVLAYSVIPRQHHELIAYRAAAVLLGYDASGTGSFAVGMYGQREDMEIKGATRRTDPVKVNS